MISAPVLGALAVCLATGTPAKPMGEPSATPIGGEVEAPLQRYLAGTISRFAGTSEAGFDGDGGPARSARLNGPAGLAIDHAGNVFIADLRNHAIRRVEVRTGVMTTVAGCGERGFAGDGGPATEGRLSAPEGVAVDADGNIYIADSGNQRIRKVHARTGTITTIAGTGLPGFDPAVQPAIRARLHHPSGVVADRAGSVYFNDYANDVIRRVDPAGIISTIAGTGKPGFSGDDGPAARAEINDVYGIALDRAGSLFFVDSLNFRVRRIDAATGIISTVLGDGPPGPVVEFAPVVEARLGGRAHAKGTIGSAVAHGVDVDSEGNVFVAETGLHRIRMLHRASGRFFTIAGCGTSGVAVEGQPAREAAIETHGVRVGPDGTLYSVDFQHHFVYAIRFPEEPDDLRYERCLGAATRERRESGARQIASKRE